jgi:hypothetical protein
MNSELLCLIPDNIADLSKVFSPSFGKILARQAQGRAAWKPFVGIENCSDCFFRGPIEVVSPVLARLAEKLPEN